MELSGWQEGLAEIKCTLKIYKIICSTHVSDHMGNKWCFLPMLTARMPVR